MKHLLLLSIALSSVITLRAQIGIGTNDPKANLHVLGDPTNTQVVDGVIPPKLTRAQLIAKSGLYGPNQVGTLLFVSDLTGTPNASTSLITTVGFYYFDGIYWQPLKGSAVPMVDASPAGFPTHVIKDLPVTNMVFKVTVTNNSFSTASLAFQNSDLALTGVAGLTVSTTSPATANLIAGQSVEVSYTITGTPTTTGTLTATWTKLSLTCSAFKEVKTVGQSLQDNNYASSAALNYLFVKDVAATSNNTFTVTFTNNSSGTINGLAAPNISNLVLSGAGSAGLSVASVSPSGLYNLAAGGSKTFTYTLAGTPTSTGTLTATWSYYDLSATANKTVVQLKATGGNVVAIYQSGSNYYAYHKFTSSGTLQVNEASSMNYLIVGGGGAGGKNHGGGGGAGGVLQGTYSVTTTSYPIVVGAGGSGQAPGYNTRGASGSPSSVFSLTAYGGGGGGGRNDTNNTDTGANGASGGGGAGNNPTTPGTSIYSGQGYNGGAGTTDATAGNGGGGGGAGGAGGTATGYAFSGITGAGGIGISSLITGTATYFGGGGSGGRWQTGSVGSGGIGGGGTGGAADGAAGSAGSANTGGGGGGGGGAFGLGGAGGSGVVIVSYQLQ